MVSREATQTVLPTVTMPFTDFMPRSMLLTNNMVCLEGKGKGKGREGNEERGRGT